MAAARRGPRFSARPERSPAWFLTLQAIIAKEKSGFAPLL
jgi:hypothetical protein